MPSNIPANERMCPFCIHLKADHSVVYDEYDHECYSISCDKGHFYLSEPDTPELESKFTLARTCGDFETPKPVV